MTIYYFSAIRIFTPCLRVFGILYMGILSKGKAIAHGHMHVEIG